jgi:HEPN domain-containing protein
MPRPRHSGGSEQVKASRHRLDDARALFDAGRWRGCMYMAGYSVECLLKAKLMQRFRCRNLEVLEEALHRRKLIRRGRSVFTHELDPLLELLGAKDRLKGNADAHAAFRLVNAWQPAWRYSPDLANREVASQFMDGVRILYRWVLNNV